jgi:hypothetical protein
MTTAPSIGAARLRPLCLAAALSLGLQACGGGSDDAAGTAPLPDFAGNYTLTLEKTFDDCRSDYPKNSRVEQVVRQSGRNISIEGNGVTLLGGVDADNAGFTSAAEETVRGVLVRSSVSYRATGTPGLHTVLYSIKLSANAQNCNIAYKGQAQRH